MRLLRRRSEGSAEDGATQEADDAPDGPGSRPQAGKGRPTPKRREGQRRRTGPVAPPPRSRREAYRRMREQGSVRRSEARAGVRSGDERHLPARDKGEVRGYVRDIVDSRRNVGSLFLIIAVLVFAGYFIPNAQVRAFSITLWLAVFVLVVLDSVVLGLRIRQLVRQRFADSTERTGGLVYYGISRALMIRRWRMPAPRVRSGASV